MEKFFCLSSSTNPIASALLSLSFFFVPLGNHYPPMSNFEAVAQQFVEFYYNTFDTDRSKLNGLYRENSMLTFESSATQGAGAIVEKLANLPFQKVKHKVSTLDAQPGSNDSVLVLVTGQLLVDEEQRPMNYVQTFQLVKEASGNYFVFNDIFKLVYG